MCINGLKSSNMKLNESKMLKLAGIIKESEMLNEEDRKFYATPEYVEKKLELAYK
jgi:hypothetical protein